MRSIRFLLVIMLLACCPVVYASWNWTGSLASPEAVAWFDQVKAKGLGEHKIPYLAETLFGTFFPGKWACDDSGYVDTCFGLLVYFDYAAVNKSLKSKEACYTEFGVAILKLGAAIVRLSGVKRFVMVVSHNDEFFDVARFNAKGRVLSSLRYKVEQ